MAGYSGRLAALAEQPPDDRCPLVQLQVARLDKNRFSDELPGPLGFRKLLFKNDGKTKSVSGSRLDSENFYR